MLKRLKDIRVQFIVGDRDAGWLSQSKSYHERLTGMGVSTKLDIIKGGGHILKDLFGAPFMSKLAWGR